LSIEDNRDSPYQQMKRDRYKINNLVSFGSETTSNKNEWCPSLICKVRLVVNREGIILCPECGRTVTKEQQQQEQEQKQLKLQQNESPKSFVISQSTKSKQRKQIGSTNDSLSEEDLKDLANAGINVS
jgi:uncharacterized Zn finger protein (UPF0148 family)